jgi:hypothetical protein
MDQDKRAVIIREIQYWKRSKLLPEQYCDFLLNLYSSGEREASAARDHSAMAAMRDSNVLLWIAALGIIAMLTIVALNFNVFPFPLQITASMLFVIALIVFGIRIVRRNIAIAYLSLGAGCLLMLLAGEWMLITHGYGQSGWAIGYLALCCMLWTFIGSYLRLAFLCFSGLTGILFVYAWLQTVWLEPLYGVWLQLAWLLAAVLFIALARQAGQRLRPLGRVWFIEGCIAWLAPEIMEAIFGSELSLGLQVVLISKIIVAGLLLLIYRKRWIEWVV